MLVRIVAQNLEYGALRDGDGNPQDRWPLLAERISKTVPDIVLLNEAVGWDAHANRQLARAMTDLDLDAAPLPPSASGYRSAILYRTATVGRWQRILVDKAGQTTHGFLVVPFAIPGLPAPLTVAVGHLDPSSGDKALAEAQVLAARAYRFGPFVVIGGDMNFPPAAGPDPDYTQMRPYNLAARTLLDPHPNRTPRPDRRAAQALGKAGFFDVAWELHQHTGNPALLRRTSHDDRIDRFHASAPLRSAISNYQVLDEPARASDHHGITVDVHTEAIDCTNLWTYR